MQQKLMTVEPSYFSGLTKGERTLTLAKKQSATLSMVELVESTCGLVHQAWGKGLHPDNPDFDVARRGAGALRNLDTTKRVGNDVNNPAQQVWAIYNDGIYSMERALIYTKQFEESEQCYVWKDERCARRALACAILVRTKDPESQAAYKAAISLPMKSLSPDKVNEHKKKANVFQTKALNPKDKLDRFNSGRLENLVNGMIKELEARYDEVGEILIATDRKLLACARYKEAMIRHTEILHMKVRKFLAFVAGGGTLTEAQAYEVATNMHMLSAALREIDALPVRHSLNHSADELNAAADCVEKNDLKGAAALLEVTARSMECQFVDQDAQELLLLARLFEDEVVLPSKDKIDALVADLEILVGRLPRGLDKGFKTPIVEDKRGRLQVAIDCAREKNGPNMDQIADCLAWQAETT